MRFSFVPMKEAPLKLLYNETHCVDLLSARIRSHLKGVIDSRPIVLVCVGTDRSTGDSLGPLVGRTLDRNPSFLPPVYGTIDRPVHAMNLSETLQEVHRNHKDPFIIGVDACLGQLTSVGCIQVGQGPVKPGAGVNKELPPVGDIHVTGIVNVGGFMEYFVLQNTRLSLVMSMAEVISDSFLMSVARPEPFREREALFPSQKA